MNDQRSKLATIVLTALVSAVVFCTIGYYLGQSKNIADISYGTTPQVTASATIEASNNTTDNAEWKIYTNKQYDYSFQYPANWQVQGESTDVSVMPPETPAEGLTFRTGPSMTQSPNPDNKLISTVKTTLAGLPATKRTYRDKDADKAGITDQDLVEIEIRSGNKEVTIDNDTMGSSFIDTYNKILDSFKFTD